MPIRETFWNIPHWAEIGQYIAALLTALVFAYGIWRRFRRWRMGKPERRTDKLGARLWSVIEQAIVQRRSLKDFLPGFMHLLVFWGIVVLLIGTALATVDWDVTHLFFDFQFLTGTVYVLFEIFLDIFGILLLIGLGIAIYRRYIARPDRLQNMPSRALAGDDAYVIVRPEIGKLMSK